MFDCTITSKALCPSAPVAVQLKKHIAFEASLLNKYGTFFGFSPHCKQKAKASIHFANLAKFS